MARVMVRGKTQDFLFLQARAELEDALSQYHELVDLQDDVSSLCRLVDHLHQLTNRQEREMADLEGNVEANTKRLQKAARDVQTARKGYR